jgi:SpoIIAA-like
MIDLVEGFPDNVVALSAHGLVTAEDHGKVMTVAVQTALQRHDKIRLFYEIGPNFTGFDLSSVMGDAPVGGGRLFHWERVALVTDVSWIRDCILMISLLIPAEIRIFEIGEVDEAKRWVAA